MTEKYVDSNDMSEDRRRALKAIGGTAIALSTAGLSACSGGDSSSEQAESAAESAVDSMNRAASDAMDSVEDAANETMDAVEDVANDAAEAVDETMEDIEEAAEEVVESAEDAAADASSLPQLDESDPQAQALGYVNNASSVDQAAQPRFAPGQNCSNCALYTGGEGDQWGPCSIFPGKAVNADAWCSVYAPKA